MKISKYTPLCIAATFSYSLAVLDLPNAQPKVDASYWKAALDSTWQGLIRRNIDPYSEGKGLIHRPKSETPGDAVSEAVGYGMLVALYANDQDHFNTIWDAANNKMWGGCYYNWQMAPSGNISGKGAATDAEEDVALALIFADKLVSAGKWKPYTSTKFGYGYADHAKKILDCMWSTKQITSNGILAPGADWGGNDFVNPGYFSPAWYKVFAKFDSNGDRWNNVVNKTYEILENSPGYSMGMIPDWMRPDGGWAGSLGYNAYFNSRAFFKDAIRILWRVAIDAVWFDESRAKAFLKNSLSFINSKGGAAAANYYQIENPGELLPADDIWTDFNDSKNKDTWRYRREHSHLTIGMWSTAALAVGESKDRIDFSEELGKFYEGGDYFGLAVDPTGGLEDTLHNEMYFDQFLAWFGASMMSGTFVNVIDAIDNPQTATPGDSSSLTSRKTDALLTKATAPGKIRFNRIGNDILFSTSKTASWHVYDMNGNEMTTANGSEFLWKDARRGMYMVTARGAGFRHAQKIVIR
ncbi:glycosyl hydrolase family 8 [uncultured Fibrobacter sp.]|uniref:glycosyl hydrolase family 8 n=1 Tax=uncultured Fibrobacter sp. TaxID=261512 RepID=UPI00260BEB2A|nr:glycosyl hydrolase family 8 [uncultured Fibrobacter sp.]